jgi:hypothetical protein
MKIQKDDLYDNGSLITRQIKEFDVEIQALTNRVERMRNLQHLIINGVREGLIVDTNTVDLAMSWLNHSQLSADEIMQKLDIY